MEESSCKVLQLNGQLLKLDSLLRALNADLSETVLHWCYRDALLVHLKINCSTTVCTEFVWIISLTLLINFFLYPKPGKTEDKAASLGLLVKIAVVNWNGNN